MNNTWLDTNEYPFQSHYFEVNGHRMHYIDEGVGETILFVHGTPSWSFDFRNIIKSLNDKYRCIAVDHIGFGLSEKPEDYDYSTSNHSDTLEKFIIDKQLNNFTMVVHDFGGPIGLNVAIEHPHKIKNLVVFNTWLWSSAQEPDFIKFSKILKSPLLPFLYLKLNFSARVLLPGSFGEKKLSRKFKKQYTKPFTNSKQRYGTLAFARSLLHDQDWFEELWQQKEAIAHKPTLFIWGVKDSFIGPKYLDKFISGFTNSTVIRLEKCGHFPQEEEPEQVSQEMMKFLEGNG